MAGGRPTKYDGVNLRLVYYMARTGLTEVEIAKELGIAKATLTNWKRKHPEFLASLNKGRLVPDDLVEASLFQKAIGFHKKDVKIFQYEGKIVTAEYEKYYPPDTTADIFWLKNRRPEQWREKQDHQVAGTIIFRPQKIVKNKKKK